MVQEDLEDFGDVVKKKVKIGTAEQRKVRPDVPVQKEPIEADFWQLYPFNNETNERKVHIYVHGKTGTGKTMFY